MQAGAHTPEELETLFEDACVTRDRHAVAALFEDGAVLVAGATPKQARGPREISRVTAEMWSRDFTYLADPRRVLQARSTALVVAQHGINVVRRGGDGRWRYAIALLSAQDHPTDQEEP